MNSSLDSLKDNLSEIKNKTCLRCKERNKTTQPCKFVKLNENRFMHKCLECQEVWYNQLQPLIIDKCPNTYTLCTNNNQNLILLLREGLDPYEYIDDWKKFNDTELPTKKDSIVIYI